MNHVKRILYNEVPKTNEEIDHLYDIIEMVVNHIDKGLHFRFVIEELEMDEDTLGRS